MACSMPPMYWSTGIQRVGGLGVDRGVGRPMGRKSAGNTRTNRRTCPSCPSRARPARRSAGTSSTGTRRLSAGVTRPVGRNSTSSGSSTGRSGLRTGHDPVVRAINDRDRAAPVALAGHQPVPQAVLDGALDRCPFSSSQAMAFCLGFGRVDDPVQPFAVYPRPVARVGLAVPALGRLDGAEYGQAVGGGELPVPLVLAGHGHDGARAVTHQHIVGQVDGDFFAVERVDGVGAR